MAARRATATSMMRPSVYIRTQAFRQGLFGPSRLWRAIAIAIIARRVSKRLFGRHPEMIEVAILRGGGHFMDVRTFTPTSRRARRRAAG